MDAQTALAPAVWVVIATRERPDWICSQLDALTPQLRDDDRIIVVIDACPRTEEALAARTPDAVEVIALASQVGVDKARRMGNGLVPCVVPATTTEARGQFRDVVVIEIDDHDTAKPTLVEVVRRTFEDAPFAVLAYCDVYHADPGREVVKERAKRDGPLASTGNLAWGMRAYPRWVYAAIGGRPTGHFPCNDYAQDCAMEQFGGAERVVHIRELLVTVTEDKTGISGQHAEDQRKVVVAVANRALKRQFALPFAMEHGPPPPAPNVTADEDTSGAGPMPAITDRAPERGIPKLLHFVWAGPPMPAWARRNIELFKALNPDYVCLIHGEEVIMAELVPLYAAITGDHEWARRSDLLRVSALLKFGGWYFDCDFVPFASITDILARYGAPHGFFLTQGTPTLVANGVIGTSINAKFLGIVRGALRGLAKRGGNMPWGAFGPQLYTDLVAANPGLVVVGAQEDFYPYQRRGDSLAAHARLAASNFTAYAYEREFANACGLPMMMHMSVQDENEVVDAATPAD